MEDELKELNANPISGTKKANEGNANSALRFSLSLKSKAFKRWKKYLFTTEDEIVKKL
jgi:hypothetical protein